MHGLHCQNTYIVYATTKNLKLQVQLKPRPWHERWERKNLQGVLDLGLPERFYKRAKELETPWEKYDLMKEYRLV